MLHILLEIFPFPQLKCQNAKNIKKILFQFLSYSTSVIENVPHPNSIPSLY